MKKIFYVTARYNREGFSWPTENFTDDELMIVQRFLDELDLHSNDEAIEDIIIMDDDFE